MQTEFQAETSNEGSEIQIEASDWRDGGLKHRDGLKRCWPLKFMCQAKFLRFPGACRGGEERVLEESGGQSEQIHSGSHATAPDVCVRCLWAAECGGVTRDLVWS